MSGLQFIADWFSHHIPLWQELLGRYAHQPNVHMLEIGSWEGRSACWLLQNILTHETSSLTCIDTFHMEEHIQKATSHVTGVPIPVDFDMRQRFDQNIACVGGQDRTVVIPGVSADIVRTLPKEYYDCIYIDGDHCAKQVLCDAVLCWHVLKKNGLLIFDDYRLKLSPKELDHPQMAIDAFMDVYKGHYELVHKEWQVVLRKIT